MVVEMADSAAFVDKYRPRTVSDFVGLDKPKRVLGRFAEAPRQLAFLSKLDSTAPFPHTVVIFTANSTDGLEKRFLSRCLRLDFSSYGMADDTAQLLANVWQAEAPGDASAPDFRRIVKESTNNIRDALNRLELEVMAA